MHSTLSWFESSTVTQGDKMGYIEEAEEMFDCSMYKKSGMEEETVEYEIVD